MKLLWYSTRYDLDV